MADDSSELSDLSSVASIDSEPEKEPTPKKGILKFFPKLKSKPAPAPTEPAPPPRKRSPSPAHEPVLADNPHIAFLVMYRNRFSECFPKSLAHLGPQDIERDVIETALGEQTEQFLCAVLGLLLNRKQDVKPGHYNRALEDAISTHKSQWARSWGDKSPLSGGATITTMTPTERITLLYTLAVWSLSSSEAIRGVINQNYKQNRQEDDLNQGLSVQPCGSDSDKRRYYLIEGEGDTPFRIYRESNPAGFNRTWRSVAGTIEELNALAERLSSKDGGPKARQLGQKITSAIPRFEATEEKRKRREYRLMRKAQFKRPEPGYSLYEGRTRGKRIKYTYDDDDDFNSDSTSARRSTRNTGTHTPAEPAGPVTTASGRQIRAPERMGTGTDGTRSTTASVQGDIPDDFEVSMVSSTGRPRRAAAARGVVTNNRKPRGSKSTEDSTDDVSEPDYGDDEDDVDEHVPEEDEEDEDEFDDNEAMVEDDLDETPQQKQKLIVKLSVKKERKGGKGSASPTGAAEPGDDSVEMTDAPPPRPGTPTEAGASKPNAQLGTPKSSPMDDEQPSKGLPSTALAFRGSPDKAASMVG